VVTENSIQRFSTRCNALYILVGGLTRVALAVADFKGIRDDSIFGRDSFNGRRRLEICQPFLQQHKINYPIVIGNSEMGDRFGFNSMPATLLIDRNGKIADLHVGMVDKDAFERNPKYCLRKARPIRLLNEPTPGKRRNLPCPLTLQKPGRSKWKFLS